MENLIKMLMYMQTLTDEQPVHKLELIHRN